MFFFFKFYKDTRYFEERNSIDKVQSKDEAKSSFIQTFFGEIFVLN